MTTPRIMIVEDERLIAVHITRRLTRLGYMIVALAATGADAIALVLTRQPDLVLMDIHLQGKMDGIKAARRILAQRYIPIVYMSAYVDDATLARASATYPAGYLRKPFSERELQTTLEQALIYHPPFRQNHAQDAG
jgi:CheY-like chemotaxis protein